MNGFMDICEKEEKTDFINIKNFLLRGKPPKS